MKKLNILLIGFSILLFAGCKQETKPKVIYDVTKNKGRVTKRDTAQIEIADLPIQMQGTNYMIHPVGDLSVLDGKARYADRVSFTISNTSEFEITGYLRNLKFQEIGSDTIKSLTDKPMLIQTATYLKTVADRTKQQIMVYTLADRDTNKDGKLDTGDIKTLYISEISGKRLMKLSPELQDLIDWNVLESKNRLYFRTIEDANKNGQFDKTDIIYYHFVDLSNNGWKVLDYKPI